MGCRRIKMLKRSLSPSRAEMNHVVSVYSSTGLLKAGAFTVGRHLVAGIHKYHVKVNESGSKQQSETGGL